MVVDEVYFKMVFPGIEALSFGEVTEDVPVIVLSGYFYIDAGCRRYYQSQDGFSPGQLYLTSTTSWTK